MPDKNIPQQAPSPFAQRAQRQAQLASPTSVEATPAPGPGGEIQKPNLDEFKAKIDGAKKKEELSGVISELNNLRLRLESNANPTATAGAPMSRAPSDGTGMPLVPKSPAGTPSLPPAQPSKAPNRSVFGRRVVG